MPNLWSAGRFGLQASRESPSYLSYPSYRSYEAYPSPHANMAGLMHIERS
jgi:hypothetical protein